MEEQEAIRTFSTGATRNRDDDKLDYEAFLSPRVLRVFAEYMHGCARQPNGVVRSGDNWQKGIPPSSYMKSMARHFMFAWEMHRQEGASLVDGNKLAMLDALCGLLFNAMGYIYEITKDDKCVP